MTSEQMLILRCLMLWVPALGVIAWRFWRESPPGVGLTLGYVFQMWLYYCLGGLIYTLPWSALRQERLVAVGFVESTYAILAFAAGVLVAGRLLSKYSAANKKLLSPNPKLPRLYFVTGVVMYVVLGTAIGHVPSLNAVIALGQYLMLVACYLGCWNAWHTGRKWRMIPWVVAACLMPVVTLLSQGVMERGIEALAFLLLFMTTFVRPRSLLVICYLLIAYIGLSFYTAYMRNRVELRAEVWGGKPLSDRMDRFTEMIQAVEWFDPHDRHHLMYIDGRLNQNPLVGIAVANLSHSNDFAHGETIWRALTGVIPRALWRDKPVSAGSGDLVSRFTGLRFSAGTCVNIGPVMEFYVNFGTLGIVIGFLFLGVIVSILDHLARDCLVRGDWQGFALRFLVGVACVNVGGSLFEVCSSAAAAPILATMVSRAVRARKLGFPGACGKSFETAMRRTPV